MRYLDVTETAKLIRKRLKAEFPGVKFGVRSSRFAGGTSIDIKWLDGPTDAEVNAIVRPYQSGRFDGMIDMAYDVKTWLTPDGVAHYGKSPGSERSAGVEPGYEFEPPEGAELVSMGAKFVHTRREVSPAVWWDAAKATAEEFDVTDALLEAMAFDGVRIYEGPFKGARRVGGIAGHKVDTALRERERRGLWVGRWGTYGFNSAVRGLLENNWELTNDREAA